MAHSKGRGSRAAVRRAPSTPSVKTGKTTPAPPPAPKPAGLRLDRVTILLVSVLLACATLPYLNILFNGFVHDDDFQVVQNPYVRSFHYLKAIFTSHVWSFQGGPAVINYYRPMMTLGYLLTYKMFGLRPYCFHLASLLLHAGVVCLVFALTRRLTGDRGWAFVAAAWFALHPIHTESVAWIAAVTDLELTLFYLITFGVFIALARPGGRLSRRRLALMGATFVLALLSKEQAMTLPALATVYEYFYRDDRAETSALQKLARYGVLWLEGAAYILFRIRVLGAFAPYVIYGHVTRWQIVLSAIALFGQYVWKLVWPVRLFAFYVFRPSTSPLDLWVLAGLAALLALAALFAICWRSRERNVPFASFAILWFVATLAPVLNAHWVGQNVFTERYLYLPSVGAAWLVGLSAMKLWSRASARPTQRRALAIAGIALGVLYAARIVVRDRDWNNDVVFYTRSLAVEPEPELYFDLGVVLAGQGKIDEAMAEYSQALRLKPDYPQAHVNLGMALAGQGRTDEAIAQYTEALRIQDDLRARVSLGLALASQGKIGEAIAQYKDVLRINPDYPEAHNDLGAVLATQGKIDEAMAHFTEALRLKPDYPEAHLNLGIALAGQGKIDEAITQYTEALRLKPDFPEARLKLGLALASQGRTDETIAQYTQALRTNPNDPEAHLNLGDALARQGKTQEAIAEYSEALRLKPDDAEAHLDLGDALAGQGKIGEAMVQFNDALRLKPDDPEAHLDMGVVLANQGKISEAIAQYSEVLRLKPDYARAHLNLGAVLARQGKTDAAIAQYTECLRINPDFPEAHLDLGVALAGQGKINEAMAQYSEALRLRPDFLEAQRLLNDLKARTGNPNAGNR